MTGLVALSWMTETIAPVRWGATFPLLVFMPCQLTRTALKLQNQKLPVSILKTRRTLGNAHLIPAVSDMSGSDAWFHY